MIPLPPDQEIVGLDVPVGTVLAVAGERAIDEPWIDLANRFVAKSQACRDAGSIILEEDIGLSPAPEVWPALFLLNIDGETALVSIEPDVPEDRP